VTRPAFGKKAATPQAAAQPAKAAEPAPQKTGTNDEWASF
jgi:hypothetical protein